MADSVNPGSNAGDSSLLRNTIEKTVALLEVGGEQRWAAYLRDLACKLDDTPSNLLAVATAIHKCFGGPGSFADAYCSMNGVVLREESKKLDELRSELYDICARVIVSSRRVLDHAPDLPYKPRP